VAGREPVRGTPGAALCEPSGVTTVFGRAAVRNRGVRSGASGLDGQDRAVGIEQDALCTDAHQQPACRVRRGP